MWVKTSERVPDNPGLYFAYGECQNTIYILEYDHEYGWYSENKELEKSPKYWHEITYPEPPKMELEQGKGYWIKAKYKGKSSSLNFPDEFSLPNGDAMYIQADGAEIKPAED